MKRILCENCKKSYDYDRDEFCPRCGAFNQPVKTWGVDASGNVIRADGVNEQNHKGSFVHQEVHKEKDIRRSKGMDWQPPKTAVPPRQTTGRKSSFDNWEAPTKEKKPTNVWKVIGIIVGAMILMNVILPLLVMLLGLL